MLLRFSWRPQHVPRKGHGYNIVMYIVVNKLHLMTIPISFRVVAHSLFECACCSAIMTFDDYTSYSTWLNAYAIRAFHQTMHAMSSPVISSKLQFLHAHLPHVQPGSSSFSRTHCFLSHFLLLESFPCLESGRSIRNCFLNVYVRSHRFWPVPCSPFLNRVGFNSDLPVLAEKSDREPFTRTRAGKLISTVSDDGANDLMEMSHSCAVPTKTGSTTAVAN